MRHVGARHPNGLCAPAHFAGGRGATDQAAVTTALAGLAQLPQASGRLASPSLGPDAALTPPEQELCRRVIEACTPRRVMWGANVPSSRAGGTSARGSSASRPGPGAPTTPAAGSWARPPTRSGRCCKGQPGGNNPPDGGQATDRPLLSTAVKSQHGGGRSGHQIRHAEVPLEERRVLLGREQPIGEPGSVQRLPEAVTRPGEVVPDRARPQARVDPDEDHVEVRPEHVGDRPPARCL